MQIQRKLAVTMTALALVTGLGGVSASTATAAPNSASAAVCNTQSGRNVDTGHGIMAGTYNLKNMWYSYCDNVTRVEKGTKLYFHCWVQNSSGNWWVYARIANTQTYGWMSLDNFDWGKSTSNGGTCW
ncbi:hypothetical protein [Streptomyces beigongshangae]|uniref:hypothetical protein n=1 Tax=Streptomyces beigongshangae TaxID=2841597 RepID=UPI001C84593F|nr:hypothetical protein [Streptomyces sp. REN17]